MANNNKVIKRQCRSSRTLVLLA